MKTLAQFIEEAGIVMEVSPTSDNPMMQGGQAMHHYKCALSGGDLGTCQSPMEVTFSMGSALVGPPTVADVLNCLALDASGVDQARSFEDWCKEYGYNTDSRRAEGIYDACRAQAVELKRLVGDRYAELLHEVEKD